MPPRIPIWQCVKAPKTVNEVHLPRNWASHPRQFTSTASSSASSGTQKRRKYDPYAIAQAQARKAANISRQEVLKQERTASLGDPVRGVTTPFVQSFDTGLPPHTSKETPLSTTTTIAGRDTDKNLNYFFDKDELQAGIRRSIQLSAPPAEYLNEVDTLSDETPEMRQEALKEEEANAEEAIKRIARLELGSSKDRMRVNIQRCISVFGRHNTDHVFHPDKVSEAAQEAKEGPMPRIGPDTGSSEVQIAVLTAKIRALAEFLGTRGRMDKANKRNLRLLVHRRQKLLQYLRRKDRGGQRWRHCIETLGLTEGTWKGEISL